MTSPRTLPPPSDQRDRGAVLPLVALMMTVLLGMGALVIDIGALYAERRQLQNGADAAALALAQTCATRAGCDTGAAQNTMASFYASAAARDELSFVETICGYDGRGLVSNLTPCVGPPPPNTTNALGWVKVVTRTLTTTGDQVDFLLAPIITPLTGKTVRATAIAAWGIAGAAPALPFVVPECAFDDLGGSLLAGTVPTGTVYLYSERDALSSTSFATCLARSSGETLPGNFGWIINQDNCYVDFDIAVPAPGDPGNDPNPIRQNCNVDTEVHNQTVLIAIYNSYSERGRSARYTIAGFVGFTITGYYLSGSVWPSGFTCPPPAGYRGNAGDLRCFRGQFTEVVLDGRFGGAYNTGVYTVQMIG